MTPPRLSEVAAVKPAIDTVRHFTKIGFPVLRFNGVNRHVLTARKVPFADNQFHEMAARYRTLSTPAAVL